MKHLKLLMLPLLLALTTCTPCWAAPERFDDLITNKGPWIDCRAGFGNFSACATSPRTVNKTILVSSTMAVNNVTVMDRNVLFENGGGLNVAAGKTVSFGRTASVTAGLYKIFYGSGTVRIPYQSRPVQWFGAVPDDGLDDAPAIQAAINAGNGASGRGEVDLGIGTYDTWSSLNLDFYLDFIGRNKRYSSIKAHMAAPILVANNLDYVSIRNIYLNGNSVATRGIDISNTSNGITTDNVIMENFTDSAYYITNSWLSYLSNFQIRSTPIGINAVGGAGGVNNVTFINGEIDAITTSAIKATDSYGLHAVGVNMEGYAGAAGGYMVDYNNVRGGSFVSSRMESSSNANGFRLTNCLGTIISGGSYTELRRIIEDSSTATVLTGAYLYPNATYPAVYLAAASHNFSIGENYFYPGSIDLTDASTAHDYSKWGAGTSGSAIGGQLVFKNSQIFERGTSGDAGFLSRVTGDAQGRFAMRVNGDLEWGDGTSARDTILQRTGAHLLQMASGDSFKLDGTYNGGTLRLGAYYLWVDATGKLRIKSGAPTTDLDGATVGSQ